MTSSSCASEVSGEGGKTETFLVGISWKFLCWKKKFLAFFSCFFFFFFYSSFFLASADICELLSCTCMTLIRRASPQSGQGSVGWRGVRSWVWEGCWKGKGEAEEGKTLRGPRKEDGTIGRAPWILPCRPGYSWKTAVPVSVAHKSRDL